MGGLLPEVRATFFQENHHHLYPTLRWLRQKLDAIHAEQWWLAMTAEKLVLNALCCYRLDEEATVQLLQHSLQEHTAPLVHSLINVTMCRCSKENRRLLLSYAARREHNSPTSSPSPTTSQAGSPDSSPLSSSSPEGSDREKEASTSEAALHGGPGHPPSAPVLAEQRQPQEEPGEVVAASPSAQGCSRSPSAPSQGRDSGHLGGPDTPQRGGHPAPRTLPSPARGRPTGSTSRAAAGLY